MDSWLQMAGDDGEPVFVDMASGVRQRAFPTEATLSLTPCVLPPRRYVCTSVHVCAPRMYVHARHASYRLEGTSVRLYTYVHHVCTYTLAMRPTASKVRPAATAPRLRYFSACMVCLAVHVPCLMDGWLGEEIRPLTPLLTTGMPGSYASLRVVLCPLG